MKLIFLGPPGAGKGTVAGLVKDKLKVLHISTGDLFRENIKNKTELGKKVESILKSGGLVPDDVTVEMLKERLKKSDTANGFILDGFPRTIAQAESLKTFCKIDAVINLEISEEEVIKRISGRRVAPSTGKIYHIIFNPPKKEGIDDETGEKLIQREDDKPETIKKRLEVYNKSTFPLIDFYKKEGLLKNIKADGGSESVAAELIKLLSK